MGDELGMSQEESSDRILISFDGQFIRSNDVSCLITHDTCTP